MHASSYINDPYYGTEALQCAHHAIFWLLRGGEDVRTLAGRIMIKQREPSNDNVQGSAEFVETILGCGASMQLRSETACAYNTTIRDSSRLPIRALMRCFRRNDLRSYQTLVRSRSRAGP